jgi:hypothetical protein
MPATTSRAATIAALLLAACGDQPERPAPPTVPGGHVLTATYEPESSDDGDTDTDTDTDTTTCGSSTGEEQ